MSPPGTRIDLRKNTKPINDLDAAAKIHDLAYERIGKMNSNGVLSKRDALAKIHEADNVFIEKASSSKDAPKTGKIASGLMKAKKLGEKVNLIDPKTFSGLGIIQKPCDRLKEHVGIAKDQSGGILPLIPVIVGAVVSSLSSFAIEKLFNKFSGKKGGSIGEKMDLEDKREFVLKKLEAKPAKLQIKIVKPFIQ